MRTALGLILALSVTAAGCLTLSPAAVPDATGVVSELLDVETLGEHTPIESFDGTVLDAWTFRPDVVEPVPVIINFSPYWSNLAPPTATGGDAFSKYLIEYFVPRGYAVALVSARGTGLSEGCFTIGGPLELKDEDAVATFYGTQPWSNGNVTATGKSYDGTMAQGLLTMSNPHVRTIVPVSPISELYKYTYFDGVPYTNVHFNTYYVALTSLQQSTDPSDETYEQTPTRFCDESVEVQSAQYHSLATGEYSSYWQARNYTALLPDEIDASVFYIHGLKDWNVKPDNMVPWVDALRARDVTVKMWLGEWAHDYPTRDDFNATLLAWLDHELKGIQNGILTEPLVQVQDKDGVWRDEQEWPPARAVLRTLYPSADGALGDAPGSGSSMYADRPDLIEPALVFESAPFETATRISGAPVFHALVSSTGPRATLALALVVDGVVMNQGFLDLAHRNSLESSEPMVPGQSVPVTVKFYPQDFVVPAGSTVRLVVAHDQPSGAPVVVVPVPTLAFVTVHHGHGTALVLPTLDAADARVEDPQPEDVGCWAC